MLRLRPLRPGDEAAFRAGHELVAKTDAFTFGLGLTDDMRWDDYLDLLADHRAGRNLAAHLVPSTFLVADSGGEIVGRTSIRHEFNEFLRNEGGLIGYAVLPEHRRHGYAREILRQSLVIIRSLGVDRVLVTCTDDNVGSARAIEACGGVLDPDEPYSSPSRMRRYWID
ncbi:MAG TPA: GNAT family N-acetyltransferase [Streptosporangiaceae bacterium]|nr:GNAT family N-acetyltransferase [Streptosporangiaceae bacterium]